MIFRLEQADAFTKDQCSNLPLGWGSLPSGVSDYEPLPAGWRYQDRHYCYGWAVTDQMLRDHFDRHGLKAFYTHPDVVNAKVIRNLRVLADHQGITIVMCRPDQTAICNGRVTQTEEGSYSTVLALSCTKSKSLFHRRPTPEQLDFLIKEIGEQPRWFQLWEKKSDFDKDFWY